MFLLTSPYKPVHCHAQLHTRAHRQRSKTTRTLTARCWRKNPENQGESGRIHDKNGVFRPPPCLLGSGGVVSAGGGASARAPRARVLRSVLGSGSRVPGAPQDRSWNWSVPVWRSGAPAGLQPTRLERFPVLISSPSTRRVQNLTSNTADELASMLNMLAASTSLNVRCAADKRGHGDVIGALRHDVSVSTDAGSSRTVQRRRVLP